MKTRTSKVLFLIFFLIFIILTPLVLLYSQGYRLDWAKRKLVKTGNLYLISRPAGAAVFLDKKPYQISFRERLLFYKNLLGLTKLRSLTPTLINYLYPKEYLVTLKKDGYSPWQKKIKIVSEKTVIFREILLFRNQPEIYLVKKLSLANFKFSPNLRKIATLDSSKKEMLIFDLETAQEKKFKLKGMVKDFFWLPGEEKMMVWLENSNYPLFLNLLDGSLINLRDFLEQKIVIQDIKFSSERTISFHDQSSIYQFDLANKSLDLLYRLEEKNTSLVDFILVNNLLFYLKKKRSHFFLEGFDLETKRTFYHLEVPITENYRLVNGQKWLKNFVFLQDKENLLVFDWREEKIEKSLILKMKSKNFDLKDKKIVSHDGYEISSFDFETKKKETIDRTSEEILKVLWLSRGNYLFVLFPKKIKIIEVDSGEPKNYIEYNFEKVVDLKPTKNYNFIYFIGQIKEEEGIFKIKIQ
ncbi:MAG: hypothetical protein N2259_01240 [Patescibacteria group bacterium]|nr:hypothetical protein [Patescibacteria group bacterium]